MKVGIQIAVFTMFGNGSSALLVPIKFFMGAKLMHGFLYKHVEHSRSHNFDSKALIKILQIQNYYFFALCVHM